jgi:DedD protein
VLKSAALPETSHDDGFREIHLSGKQLVFLFMAITVVLVVTFLSGVLVGRGVRTERTEAAQADALIETPATPERSTASAPPVLEADPRAAPPPSPTDDDADAKVARLPESDEPPVAAPRTSPGDTAPASPAKAAAPAVPAPDKAAPASTPEKPSSPAASASTAPSDAAAPGSGYAVQVAAVNVRGEADAIVKRLEGKGYNAYVENPKGSASMFRVRVGTFKTRREAQTVADKLKKEEKFNPWVTR